MRGKPELWMRQSKEVSFVDMRNFARRLGAHAYIECSSFANQNVHKVFELALSIALEPRVIPQKLKSGNFLKNLKTKFQQIKISKDTNPLERQGKLGMLAKTLTSSTTDPNRWGHSVIYIAPKMYIFCGATDTADQIHLENSILIWSDENEVEKVTHAASFETRTFAAATTFLDGAPSQNQSQTNMGVQKILIFGGKSSAYRADVNIFDPATREFNLWTTKKTPSARYAMTCVTYNNSMYMLGGYDNLGLICDDLYMLNTETREWTRVVLQGTPPPARMHHTAVCLNNIMVVYGGKGEGNAILDDMYLIDLKSGISARCAPEKSPGPRQNHACLALNKDEMVLIGGRTKADTLSSDVFVFSLAARQWTKVNVTGEFAKREMHTAVLTGSDIFVFGGKDNQNKPLSCTKLLPDFLTLRFYQVLPKDLSLLILTFLNPMELARFGQACHLTHDLAEEDVLWIQLCRLADPSYKYKSEKNNNNNNNNKNNGEPKKHLESLSSVWMNSFEILADPVPSDPMQP